MAYSVTDIAELIRHHLVFSEPDQALATENLRRLVTDIRGMASGSLQTEALWFFCDRCGTSVDVEMLAEDGSNFTPDGGFYCSSCLGDEEG